MNIGHISVAIQDSPTWLDEQRSLHSHIVRSIEVLPISQEWVATIYINLMAYCPHQCLINLGSQSNCITVLTNYCIGYTT
jgi:hypothetical protein